MHVANNCFAWFLLCDASCPLFQVIFSVAVSNLIGVSSKIERHAPRNTNVESQVEVDSFVALGDEPSEEISEAGRHPLSSSLLAPHLHIQHRYDRHRLDHHHLRHYHHHDRKRHRQPHHHRCRHRTTAAATATTPTTTSSIIIIIIIIIMIIMIIIVIIVTITITVTIFVTGASLRTSACTGWLDSTGLGHRASFPFSFDLSDVVVSSEARLLQLDFCSCVRSPKLRVSQYMFLARAFSLVECRINVEEGCIGYYTVPQTLRSESGCRPPAPRRKNCREVPWLIVVRGFYFMF